MFITSSGLAQFQHPSIAAHKQRRWPVVTCVSEAPWYLLVYEVSCCKGRRVSQTSLVSCDEALVELVAERTVADLKGIGRLDRHHGPGSCWGLKWIDALWTPALGEARKVGSLLLRFRAETVVRDALLRPTGELPGRQLLYSVGGLVSAPTR